MDVLVLALNTKHQFHPWKLFYIIGALCLTALALLIFFYQQMASRTIYVNPAPNATEEVKTIEQDDDGFVYVDWDYWKSVNPDVIAWVNVPGTDISQPICQAPTWSPDWYNSHDVYGYYNFLGCPFLHVDNATDGIDKSLNAVIQGHNIQGTTSGIFNAFASYADEAYAQEHQIVCLQTPQRKYLLKAFAVEVIPNAGSNTTLQTAFDSDEAFKQYIQERIDDSTVVLNDNPPKQMWTFSTCSYFLTPSNERTVVHCELMKKTEVA